MIYYRDRKVEFLRATNLLLDLLVTDQLAEGQSVAIDMLSLGEFGLQFQCETQAAVTAVRRLFPGSRWAKEYDEGCRWWRYRSTFNGVPLLIYACREAPAACVPITETVRVTRLVPITFEEREVEETVTRWHCPEAKASA